MQRIYFVGSECINYIEAYVSKACVASPDVTGSKSGEISHKYSTSKIPSEFNEFNAWAGEGWLAIGRC